MGICAEKFYDYRKKGLSIADAIEAASNDADYYKGKMTSTRLKTAIKTSLPFYLKRIHLKELTFKNPFHKKNIVLRSPQHLKKATYVNYYVNQYIKYIFSIVQHLKSENYESRRKKNFSKTSGYHCHFLRVTPLEVSF